MGYNQPWLCHPSQTHRGPHFPKCKRENEKSSGRRRPRQGDVKPDEGKIIAWIHILTSHRR